MRHAAHAVHCGPGRGTDLGWLWAMAAGGPRGHGRGRHGRGGWPGWDPGASPGWGGPRGFRSRRGDVRAAILLLLEEEPRNGYGLMQEVERRSAGHWRPSPGSVYPALAQLEDEGLIVPASTGEGKAFALTDAGRAHVAEHRERWGIPWEAATAGMPSGLPELRRAGAQVAMAAMQLAQTGDPTLIEQATKVLTDARRALYRLLADAGEEPGGEGT